MTDTSADTGPLPVFSPGGALQGNLTSNQGQPPQPDPRIAGTAEKITGLQEDSDKTFQAEQSALAGPRTALSRTLATPPPAPPTQQQMGPPPDQKDFQKDAMAWASAMAVLGAVAGRFARVPGTAALSAFGGAIKGWQQGNLQAYENAAKEWEQNAKATIDNNKAVMEKYKLELENRKLNIDEQMSNIQLISAQYHDKMMYDAAAAKNYTLVASIYEKNQQYTDKAQTAFDTLQQKRKDQQQKNEQTAQYWLSPEGSARLQIPEGQPGALTLPQKASIAQLIDLYGKKMQGSSSNRLEDEQEIAKGIESGTLPPETTGLYGAQPGVKAQLSRDKFNLPQAELQWKEAQRTVASLHGPQMERFRVLADDVQGEIARVKELAEKMKLGGVPAVNRLQLQSIIQTEGNSPKGQLATAYMTQVGVLKEKMANLVNGGYAPTEPAFKLANQQVNGDYGVDQLNASLAELDRSINYHLTAINRRDPTGGSANPYHPQQQNTPQSAPSSGWGNAQVVQ